jgi:hypothetical protein
MSSSFKLLSAIIAVGVLLIAPGTAFAGGNDGQEKGREQWHERNRNSDYRNDDYQYGREGRRDQPVWSESDREWRKEQKEREKERREALREREKDRREAARESEKNRREAEREWRKERREAARDARRNGRNRDNRYLPTDRFPFRIP